VSLARVTLSPERAELAVTRALEMLELTTRMRDTLYPPPIRFERELCV
jgi:hypothetical protein